MSDTLDEWRDRCLAAYIERRRLRPELFTVAMLDAAQTAVARLCRAGNLAVLRQFALSEEAYLRRIRPPRSGLA